MLCRICESEMACYLRLKKIANEISILYDKPTKSNGLDCSFFKCPKCGHFFYITDEGIKAIRKEELTGSIKKGEKNGELNLFAVIKETGRLVEKIPKEKEIKPNKNENQLIEVPSKICL